MHARFIRALAASVSASALMTGAAFAQGVQLDGIVVTSSKTSEAAIDALAGSSAIGREQLDVQFQADRVSEVLRTVPGVTTQETARDTATSVNIRGLQDFGRVNVLVEGARQNFQRSGHTANGVFYIEPEMIKKIDVTRGPTATIYGSGAIGGVVAFDLLDADDLLKPGEYAAIRSRTSIASNDEGKLASGTGAIRVGNFDVLGQVNGRWSNDYEDGDGEPVAGSNDKTKSNLVKARWRFAPGHQITGTLIDFNSKFEDQVEAGGSLRDTEVNNRQYTLGYTYSRPENPLIDFSAKAYRNTTELDQVRTNSVTVPTFSPVPCPPPPFIPFCIGSDTFPAGARRSFSVETEGLDVNNTSRFDLGNVKLALTYGGDTFRDSVKNFDPEEAGDELTPNGKRTVSGAFTQAHFTFFDIFDLIGAVRYDTYELEGGTTQLSDDRISPKITAGVTPIKGVTFFATYAEAFRAPAVTETLVSGFHISPANFLLTPNPNLRPEVAHNIEGGVNLKYDSIITTGDAFRAKLTVFQNKVDDYIDQVYTPGPIPDPIFSDDVLQYQNVRKATLEGIEFESIYDARAWFLGLGAARIRGVNEDTGEGLYTVPADQVTITAGFRAFDEKLIAGTRLRLVANQDRFEVEPGGIIEHADGYALVDLFGQYVVNDTATVNLNVDNLFDKNYRQHLDQYNSPGLSARVGLTMRLGAQ